MMRARDDSKTNPKVAPPQLPSGPIASIRTTSEDAEAGQDEGVVVATKGS